MNREIWGDFERLTPGSVALAELQLQKLRKLLVHVYERSAYYRGKFDNAGVDPHRFRSLDQYAAYPTFDKYEERESQARSLLEEGHPLGMHLCCDIRDVNRISASSGTTGTPSFQGHTRNDRRILAMNFARMLDLIGIRPGDRVMHAGVMSMWVAGIPAIDAMLEYGATVIPVGALVGSVRVAEMIGLTRPHAILCTPSFARHLVKKAKSDTDVDLTACGVRAVCVYGEPGGSVPEIVNELSEGFGGADVFDMSGGTSCLNPIFVSCKAHDGLHFIAPDHAYIELYDRGSGKVMPWADGAEGEFVYTGLDRECGPLIRFMDGDKMRVNLEPCACGVPGMRVAILGRVDDMLLVKGVNVFPNAIRDLVLGHGGQVTGNVRVVKPTNSPVVEPPVAVKVECRGTPSDDARRHLKESLEADIQRILRFKAEIDLYPEGALRMEYGSTGKAKILEELASARTKP